MLPRCALRRLACLLLVGALFALPARAQDGVAAGSEGDAPSSARVRGVATWRRYIWTIQRPLLQAVIEDLETSRRENAGTDTTRDFLLAYAYLAGGFREEGVPATERVRAAAPSFAGLELLAGMVAILDREHAEAEAHFTKYLDDLRKAESDPNFATDLEMLGLLHRGAHAASIGNNELALADYDAAMAMARRAGRRPATQLVQRLARVHQGENQLHLAERLMTDLMKEDPGNPNHYFNMGVLRATQNDSDGARVWFLRALRRRPDFADAHAKLAAVAAKQFRLVEMRQHLDAFAALIQESDVDREAELLAGYALYFYRMSRQFDAEGRGGDRDEALRRFQIVCERALSKRPTCFRALDLLIRAGSALGLTRARMRELRERKRALETENKDAESAFRRTLC